MADRVDRLRRLGRPGPGSRRRDRPSGLRQGARRNRRGLLLHAAAPLQATRRQAAGCEFRGFLRRHGDAPRAKERKGNRRAEARRRDRRSRHRSRTRGHRRRQVGARCRGGRLPAIHAGGRGRRARRCHHDRHRERIPAWRTLGVPILPTAIASLEWVLHHHQVVGTHGLFVGRIIATRGGEDAPLVNFQGELQTLARG